MKVYILFSESNSVHGNANFQIVETCKSIEDAKTSIAKERKNYGNDGTYLISQI